MPTLAWLVNYIKFRAHLSLKITLKQPSPALINVFNMQEDISRINATLHEKYVWYDYAY